ncbi:MAG: hypothetical protein PHI63_04055 [Patescibacteria group bacterium]|nr:hypothetical protein [Patescibacteria group bacterium]
MAQFSITGGPTLEGLEGALFNKNRDPAQRAVDFHLARGEESGTVVIVVREVERQLDTADEWCFRGSAMIIGSESGNNPMADAIAPGTTVRGYYLPASQSGWIEPL